MKMMTNTTVAESMASRFTKVMEAAQRSPPKIVPALDLSRRRRRAVGPSADLGVGAVAFIGEMRTNAAAARR